MLIVYWFIEVNKGGRCFFVTDYNPYCLTKKTCAGYWRHRRVHTWLHHRESRIIVCTIEYTINYFLSNSARMAGHIIYSLPLVIDLMVQLPETFQVILGGFNLHDQTPYCALHSLVRCWDSPPLSVLGDGIIARHLMILRIPLISGWTLPSLR